MPTRLLCFRLRDTLLLVLFVSNFCNFDQTEQSELDNEDPCNGKGIFDQEWDECACQEGYTGDACEACKAGYAGWPYCAKIPDAADNETGWAPLCEEVAALRAEMPAFIAKLGHVYEARQTVATSRRLQLREEDTTPLLSMNRSCKAQGGQGPWRLKVDLTAPDTAPEAYRKHHRMLILFSSSWPLAAPTIRFLSRIRTAYAASEEEDDTYADVHSARANGLLLKRLQEAAGGSVICMWRQTGECRSDGPREPDRDKMCSEAIPKGASGFCDCNGDGLRDANESAYNCGALNTLSCTKECDSLPGQNVSTKALPRHSLRSILQLLHRSFGGPLHADDRRLWQRAADEFNTTSDTAVKYVKYGQRHKSFFSSGGLYEEAIDERLRSLLSEVTNATSRSEAKQRLLKSGVISEVIPGLVFSLPVFTMDFCELVMQEIRNFYASKLPARRPNSMNNYGIILNEIGLESFIFDIQDAIIQPLAAILLPDEGSELESHHSFTIRYKGGEDTHLDVHTDDSDVTFNVNIFGNYSGAPLVFCGLVGEPDHRLFRTAYQHELGYAVLHRGRHRHGAEDITSGERMNLVIWSYSHNFRSSSLSQKKHQKEARPPDARCVSYTHDRDFGKFRTWPKGKKERFLGRGWCPPRGKEYTGFVPDVSDDQLPKRHSGTGQ